MAQMKTANPAKFEIEFKKSVIVKRPREEVYAFWRDLENLPRFMKHLKSVRDLGEGRSEWVADAPGGKEIAWDAEITSERESELISWRSLNNADIENAGSVQFEKKPGDGGTEVLVTFAYNPPKGKTSDSLLKMLRQHPEQEIESDLQRFKEIMERQVGYEK